LCSSADPADDRSVSDATAGVSRVLIVDDERLNRDLLERVLQREGYETLTATDGEAALAAIAAGPPDLVLLDVMLPGKDGFEVCRALKHDAATRLIPVVLVTGMHNRQQRIRGIEAGADDFLAKPFDPDELRARVHSLLRLKRYTDELDSAESVILSLALTIEARDVYTDGHCQRLARYATALGHQLALSIEQVAALRRGGYLHDVGKVGIPDAVLRKPAALTPDEYELMKQHTLIGERLCGEMRSLAPVRPIVRHHHERRDGSGYPDRLQGDSIPLLAEIVGIADVYDAMTTDRPYRAARSADETYSILAGEASRGLWRNDLVAAFIALGRAGDLGAPPAHEGGIRR
jgi:cyclic di-GMP phosphodiesterase